MRGAGGDISSIEVTMSTTNALAGGAPTDPEDHILVLRARSGDRAALSADFERSFDPRASRQRSIRFYIEQSRRWYPTVQPSCQTGGGRNGRTSFALGSCAIASR